MVKINLLFFIDVKQDRPTVNIEKNQNFNQNTAAANITNPKSKQGKLLEGGRCTTPCANVNKL